MKLLMISPKNRTVYNFRGDLVREIVGKGHDVIATGPDRTDVEQIEALGVRFVEVPMRKTGVNILEDIKYCRNLKKLMEAEKPDATLGYTAKPAIYGAIAAKRAGVKNINSMITGAGYTFTATTRKARLLGAIVKMLYRYALKRADHIIFQNADDRREFCALGLAEESKSEVVHGSGVNMEHFRPAARPKTITFLMLSRLLKSKGVGEYLQAARIVKERHSNVRFTLLGKYETAMQDAVPKETVEEYVRAGIVERFDEAADVRPYYAACSVYVLPSYREGTPRTVLEAMAMGRAIITTDANGCRDTVDEGVNGYLIAPKNVHELANAMEKYIEHPEMIQAMGMASVQLCRKKYDVKSVNQQMMRIMGI